MSREKALCGKEEIIRVAVGIVDREGMEALSVRGIAKELGVSSMTIYHYVENLRDIKREVLIKGFDRFYACIYQALNRLPVPVDRNTFCRTIAMQVFAFAAAERNVFLFMFSEGRQMFRGDAEIRPFYAFLEKLMKRAKATQNDWAAHEQAYHLFEMGVLSIAYQYSAGMENLDEEKICGYIDFFLNKCLPEETGGAAKGNRT